MRRKLLSGLLAGIMVLAAMTGCGNADKVQSGDDTEQQKQAQELCIIDDNYRNYYEIFVYSYCDSDGDGIGDLDGVKSKLEYIEEMGFNGIWFMPIMPSPTYHKYDVIDYRAIDPVYGTMQDFQELVDACHARGIRVVIDMVMNHSSTKHEWFVEACKYLNTLGADEEPDAGVCPYVDYYHFSRTQEPKYYKVPGCDWYYEGSFDSGMPDLNLENPAVLEEFKAIAEFWLKKDVDGFRMDAAMHYSDVDMSVNIRALSELYTYCKSINPNFYMVSEVWAAKTILTSYYASETPSFFNFPNSSIEGVLEKAAQGKVSATRLVNTMYDDQQTYSAAYADYIDAPFLTNHDQVRVANNLQNNLTNMKMAAGLLLTMNGSPFVYYGEEIGMMSKGQLDENKRIPMYWSDTDTGGTPRGPENADKSIKSNFAPVDVQQNDETSLLNYYKSALRLRNENPEIARGTISVVESLCNDDVAVITKTYEGSTIAILYNISEAEQTVTIGGTALAEMSICGCLTTDGSDAAMSADTVTLPAKSICILK